MLHSPVVNRRRALRHFPLMLVACLALGSAVHAQSGNATSIPNNEPRALIAPNAMAPEAVASGTESILDAGNQTLNGIITTAATQLERLADLRDPVVEAGNAYTALPNRHNKARLRATVAETLKTGVEVARVLATVDDDVKEQLGPIREGLGNMRREASSTREEFRATADKATGTVAQLEAKAADLRAKFGNADGLLDERSLPLDARQALMRLHMEVQANNLQASVARNTVLAMDAALADLAHASTSVDDIELLANQIAYAGTYLESSLAFIAKSENANIAGDKASEISQSLGDTSARFDALAKKAAGIHSNLSDLMLKYNATPAPRTVGPTIPATPSSLKDAVDWINGLNRKQTGPIVVPAPVR